MAYDAEYIKKAINGVKELMNKGVTEEYAIARIIVGFAIPYKIFITEYWRQTNRCPEAFKSYLATDND